MADTHPQSYGITSLSGKVRVVFRQDDNAINETHRVFYSTIDDGQFNEIEADLFGGSAEGPAATYRFYDSWGGYWSSTPAPSAVWFRYEYTAEIDGSEINESYYLNNNGNNYTIPELVDDNNGWSRTIIFMQGQTVPGQDGFIRGGIDWGYANSYLGRDCYQNNWLCAIPIEHYGVDYIGGFEDRRQDLYLDWHGAESTQPQNLEGSPLAWTTNDISSSNHVVSNGYGYTGHNTWGEHYWMLNVLMDCSKTNNGWFELKSYISNGPGWESNISQAGTPYTSNNHFAQCGRKNMFYRDNSSVVIEDIDPYLP